jgi:hypothetical protein
MRAPYFFALWGIPFVLIGLYLIVGRFVVDMMQREKTFYGLTNQRVVIISGLFSRTVKSLSLRNLAEVSLSVSWPGLPSTPAFELIPRPRDLYETLRGAQQNAT